MHSTFLFKTMLFVNIKKNLFLKSELTLAFIDSVSLPTWNNLVFCLNPYFPFFRQRFS